LVLLHVAGDLSGREVGEAVRVRAGAAVARSPAYDAHARPGGEAGRRYGQHAGAEPEPRADKVQTPRLQGYERLGRLAILR
jgi:hypothetical protein